ncbi:hypothetical protein [Longitalea luteola]|uniref:hypothetical protein n=1 Tax=Longitalea luteola TaxID=2812563 RepID=UPI001A978C19|nr:hypothetical protein [Longitalea luteola]
MPDKYQLFCEVTGAYKKAASWPDETAGSVTINKSVEESFIQSPNQTKLCK